MATEQKGTLETAIELQLQREAQLSEYKQAASEGGHSYAPTFDGLCYSCRVFLPGLFAQGYRCMTGCPRCHHSFVE